MTPNLVTLARILTAFGAVALFSLRPHLLAFDLTALLLTVTAILLDALDGYLARARGLATPFGAKFDILGDRLVENLFFTCFAASGLISLWVPVLFFARGALTDFLRGLAGRPGGHVCDQDGMAKTGWGRSLVASRASRASYATLKCLCFCSLGLLLLIRHLPDAQSNGWVGKSVLTRPFTIAQAITLATVVFCIVRAIPVIGEGRRYFSARQKAPRTVPVAASR
jgi:phosphatidylglycerophosphate synthase